jgi:hypothetical protein
MIKWLIKIFFGKELNKIIGEARKILEETKKHAKKEFINYERIDPESQHFLYGMQPLYENKYLISWLNEHRIQCLSLVNKSLAAGDDKRAINILSQITMIENLFLDIEEFKRRYDEMIYQKETERNE